MLVGVSHCIAVVTLQGTYVSSFPGKLNDTFENSLLPSLRYVCIVLLSGT